MEVEEPPRSQRQASFPVETQRVGQEAEDDLPTVENREEQGRREEKMVEAQTQTRKRNGENKSSQTEVVVQRHQETQTDFTVAKQADAESVAESQLTADAPQDDHSAQTPRSQNQDGGGASSHQEQSSQEEAGPAAGRSAESTDSQTKTEARPKSGGGGGDRRSEAANETPSQSRRR